MSKKQPPQPPPDDGARRASELAQVFTAYPAYNDDSMFTMTRYHMKANETMSKRDHDKFMDAINGLSAIWASSIKPVTNVVDATASEAQTPTCSSPHAGETVAERAKRTASLRKEAMEAVKSYPELAGEFDKFCIASRSAIRTMGIPPNN